MLKKLLIPIKFIWNHPVTRNSRFFGFVRFINWQIKSRLSSSTQHVNWIGNLKLSAHKSMHGATGCIYVGLPEFNDMSFLLHYLNKDGNFIDIGANVGVYSLLAAGMKGCDTISIEPIPQTFKFLNENVKVNNLENKIKTLNIGLSNKQGQLFFTKDKDTINHVTDKEAENTIKVEVNTLDNVLSNILLNNTLIKLDVEGFEYNVLNGAKNLLQNKKLNAFIVELNGSSNKYGLNDSMVDELLIKNGFEKYDYNPFNRTLTKLDKFHTEENTLYLRQSNIDEITSTIKKSPAFKIFNLSI